MQNFSQICTPSKTFEVKILTEISPSNLLKNAFGGILRLQYRHKKEISKTFFDAGFETGLKLILKLVLILILNQNLNLVFEPGFDTNFETNFELVLKLILRLILKLGFETGRVLKILRRYFEKFPPPK